MNSEDCHQMVDEIDRRLFEQFKLLSGINLTNIPPVTVEVAQENIRLMLEIAKTVLQSQ